MYKSLLTTGFPTINPVILAIGQITERISYHIIRGEVPLNKSELISAIAEEAEISKAAAGRALDATVNAVTKSLKKGETVTLIGFGAFEVRKRAARKGRNPRTGEEIKIKASKNPAFRAFKALKDAVN